MSAKLIIFSWGQAIKKSNLEPTTRSVLQNLKTYMNSDGDGCFPSIKQQARDTGYSERTICTHIDLAVGAGFLEKTQHGYRGRKWKRNEYRARFPDNAELYKGQNDKKSDRSSFSERPNKPQGTEGGSVPQRNKALNLTQEGTEPDDNKALKEVQSNYPVNNQKKKDISNEISKKSNKSIDQFECFDRFWEQFPRQRRGNKQKALQAWCRALKENRATEREIIHGTMQYAASDEVNRGYAKGAAAWLNDDRWSSDYSPPNLDTGGCYPGQKQPYSDYVLDITDAALRVLQVRSKQENGTNGEGGFATPDGGGDVFGQSLQTLLSPGTGDGTSETFADAQAD